MRRDRSRPLLRLSGMLFAMALALPASGLAPAAADTAPANAATSAGDEDPNAPLHGLKGDYFRMSQPGARDFAELGGTAVDPNVEFPDLTSTFRSVTGRAEHTTARWTGRITAPRDGAYTFSATGDNGFRLFIDDKPVIDHWVPDQDNEQHSKPVKLAAGKPHRVRLEMFQDTGGANMSLKWSSSRLAKQAVPESALTPPADYRPYPVALSAGADGRHLQATFNDPVTDTAEVRKHLRVEADTTRMPVTSVTPAAGNPRALTVTLGQPIQRSQQIRFAYDGKGGLRAGGKQVPQLIRKAKNRSTHRLTTPWGQKLDRNNPLPEYPRPQQRRAKWQNLNGPWQFAGARKGEQPQFGTALGEKITVPFPTESQLSGIERHEDHMFYRKMIDVPRNWSVGHGKRLKLNFGAVDNEATVWVNGTRVARHTGGYTGFSADITDALKGSGKQEIVVGVTDTGGDNQPKGKQSKDPNGIWYTQSSGIWQTVWMEPVADTAVDKLVTTPNIRDHSLAVTAKSATASPGARVEAVARDRNGRKVGSVTGPANGKLRLPVKDQHLWTPDNPYLYDLDVTLRDGPSTDHVSSYFGMRSTGIKKVGGHPKLMLNGKPFFSLAMLDQGFWPDGLHTQPSDDALSYDLKAQKKLGFNAVRKHIKVESPRWYYHADKLGLLVWQDFVSGDLTNKKGRQAFQSEGKQMMSQLHNSPSIGGWTVFNEGWGEWDRNATGRIADSVKQADPSRVVNAHSGVNCCESKGDSGKGEIVDHHDYDNVDPPTPDVQRAALDGEHGGFTLRTPGHMWPGAPADVYSGVDNRKQLTDTYVRNTRKYYLSQAAAGLSGSVYTQVSDLENELNGMLTYDRRQFKVDPRKVREINRKVIKAGEGAGKN